MTGIAIVQKPLSQPVLLWVVDARTGAPLPNQKVRVVEEGEGGWFRSARIDTTLVSSDQRGVAEYRYLPGRHYGSYLIASAEGAA